MTSTLVTLLGHMGWEVKQGAPDTTVEARFGGGPWVRFAMAGVSQSRGRAAPGLLVHLYDDGQESPPARKDWADLRTIASRAHEGGEVHARFGWDLVFGFGERSSAQPNDYLAYLKQAYAVADNPLEKQAVGACSILMKADRSTERIDLTISQVQDVLLRARTMPAGLDRTLQRNALLAYRGCIAGRAADQATYLVSELISKHVTDLTGSETALTCVPLLMIGEHMKLDGLENAIRLAFWRATGRSYSREVYAGLAGLGYLHLYVANGEALRVDQDFDPNTRHITELFNYCEGGRFTLCCNRDFVFHDGASLPEPGAAEEDRWELGALRTLGQRFFLAETFYLVDFGERDQSDLEVIAAHGADTLRRLAEKVSKRSGGRCSEEEAAAAFRELAVQGLTSDANVFAGGDLRERAADILTQERRRPTHISVVESAFSESGALSELSGGRLMFLDSLLAEYLLATQIADALRYAFIVGDNRRIVEVFDQRISAPGVYRLACKLAEIESIPNVAIELRRVLAGFDLFAGPKTELQINAENMFRLYFAAVDHLVGCKMWKGRSAAFAAINGVNKLQLAGMALPQFTFRDVVMVGWQFDNCNFRSAAFIGANMTRFRATDCYLGGAVFKASRLDIYTDFSKSNLSGAWFGGGTNPEGLFGAERSNDRLKDINWTLAYIDGKSTEHDDDDVVEVTTTQEKFSRMRAGGGVLTDLTVIGRDQEVRSSGLPANFEAALRRGMWSSAVIDPDAERAFQVVKAESILRRGSGDKPKAQLVAQVSLNGAPAFVALDAEKAVWITGRGAGWPGEWKRVGQLAVRGEIRRLECFDQDNHPNAMLAAVDVEAEDGHSIVVIEAETSGDKVSGVRQTTIPCQHGAAVIRTMAWIRHSSQVAPEVYYGTAAGAVWRIAQAEGGLRPEQVAWPFKGAGIGGLGFARRGRVLVVAYDNGLVTGIQTPANRDAPPLFSFKTAIRRVLGVVYLEGAGDQMVVVGLTSEDEEDRKRPLCILMNASGDVLAVFMRPIDEEESSEERRRQPGQAADTRALGAAKDASSSPTGAYDGEQLKQFLAKYRPESARLQVRPVSDTSDLTFRINTGDALLGQVLELADGQAFRQFTLHVACWNEQDQSLRPVQTTFIDHECSVKPAGQQLEISAPIRFSQETARSEVRVNIAYRSNDELLAETNCEVQLDVIWRDNPYESSGRAAGSRQYFGRERESKFCLDRLSAGKGVGIRAARRMGKSSFLSSMARSLLKDGHLAVVVSLAGSDRPAADLASLIVRGLEDPLASAPRNFVDLVRADFRSRAPRGRAAIERLSELAKVFKQPTVVFIDEWGVVANPQSRQADMAFEQAVGELIQNPGAHAVAVCLASTPADFDYKASVHTSHFYRGLQDGWVDMGPLDDKELERVMIAPIDQSQGMVQDPEASLATLKMLSSGDPYAANIIMSRAYDMAMARAGAAKAAAKGGNTMLHVTPADIGSDQVRRDLAGIYDVHMRYTLDLLSPENKAKLVAEAGRTTPPWEAEQIEIPEDHSDPRQWGVFGAAGFRRRMESGAGRFAVWIPRGYSLNIAARGAPGMPGGIKK